MDSLQTAPIHSYETDFFGVRQRSGGDEGALSVGRCDLAISVIDDCLIQAGVVVLADVRVDPEHSAGVPTHGAVLTDLAPVELALVFDGIGRKVPLVVHVHVPDLRIDGSPRIVLRSRLGADAHRIAAVAGACGADGLSDRNGFLDRFAGIHNVGRWTDGHLVRSARTEVAGMVFGIRDGLFRSAAGTG